MKSLSASSVAVLALAVALLCGPARAGGLEDAAACLEKTHLTCAREGVDALRADGETGEALDLLEARVWFHEGRSSQAAGTLARLSRDDPAAYAEGTEGGYYLALYTQTAVAHDGLVETVQGNVTIVHHPGIDRLLVTEALDALTLAQERIAPLLGGNPPEPVRVEIYPDGDSFTKASSLPLEAIQTTGVVAISKWNRLLMVSPRVLGRGYGWKDTLVHEWIHGVVAWHSDDHCPVWLQEGIAKGLDMLWHRDDFHLDLKMQGLLAEGLQTGNWVTLEQMHPSFALLPSADMAGLAYAQVATQVELVRSAQGPDAMARVLALIRDGDAADAAMAKVYGVDDYAALEVDWKVFIGEMDLVQQQLAALPIVLDGQGDSFATDPHLSQDRERADKARLGDLMAERHHPEAALLYYEQALPEDETPGPDLSLRLATVHLALGHQDRARDLLAESLAAYPEYAPTHRLMGQVLLDAGDTVGAIRELALSTDTDPFHLETQQTLARLLAESGQEEAAARRRGYVDVLYYR